MVRCNSLQKILLPNNYFFIEIVADAACNPCEDAVTTTMLSFSFDCRTAKHNPLKALC
jgi:hypothetical protein